MDLKMTNWTLVRAEKRVVSIITGGTAKWEFEVWEELEKLKEGDECCREVYKLLLKVSRQLAALTAWSEFLVGVDWDTVQGKHRKGDGGGGTPPPPPSWPP